MLCGERAGSDALLNLILFLPLGVAVGLFRRPARQSLLGPLLLSLLIELAQLRLPGRDPSIGDVLFNTLGAAAGVGAVRSAAVWLKPSAGLAPRYLVSATALALGVLVATGLILQPSLHGSTYFGQWAPNQAHLEWYRAQVLSVTLGGLDIGSGRLENTAMVRDLLVRGALLEVHAVAGPAVQGMGSMFSISDDRQRELVLIGPDRNDLVWRFRTRAADLRLDQPDLRFAGGARLLVPGEPVTVRVGRDSAGWCIAAMQERRCGLGFRLRDGWGLLMFPESLPGWFRSMLGKAWLVGLLVPVGLYARRGAGSVAAVSLVLAAVAFVPLLTGLLPSTAPDWLASLGGIAGGLGLGTALRRQGASG